ncbi:MAG TPA: zf-TFIIB domain-containing protein [Rugosimonospora sp.]|nr:zf-TFIIB domain-containing protein [Rugosimonospora sp.]
MQCPVDGTILVLAERGGVEIDYCPQCRGVWLDRGELDRIIDRVGSGSRDDSDGRYPERDRHHEHDHDHEHERPYREHDDGDRQGWGRRTGRRRGGPLSALGDLLGGD